MRLNSIRDPGNPAGPKIGISSFGTKERPDGIASQFEFDVTGLRDPSAQQQFTGLDGRSEIVRNWISQDKRVEGIVHQCKILADDLIKPKARVIAGVTRHDPISVWLSFSFSDHHGKWISPAIAEIVASALDKEGYMVYVVHDTFSGEKNDSSSKD